MDYIFNHFSQFAHHKVFHLCTVFKNIAKSPILLHFRGIKALFIMHNGYSEYDVISAKNGS
uniref:Uncharacterized protein n=1 Tax=uncultured bacterium Contigcl_1565 TaxID=1393654 RepID=W0FSW3_9BACT|nr:hypothetical protein [uncultured bacterium Contigcl_1565]